MTHLEMFHDTEPTLLDAIEIVSPCNVPWDSLRGDGRVRTCGQCRKNVYNISALTRVEALRLIRENNGPICVRLRRRPDGTVVTGDCWARLRAARRRGLLPFVCMLFVVGCIQLVAMVVGLRGLGNLVAGHRMGGAPVPMPVAPPDVPASRLSSPLPKFDAVEVEGDWFMGKKAPPKEKPTPAVKAKPPGKATKTKFWSSHHSSTITLGRMAEPNRKK